MDAANSQLKLVAEQFRRQYPEWMDSRESVAAVPMQEEMSRELRPTLLILMGAVTLVLLIACANLANLLLARAVGRQRALAIRMALGASRMQLIKQLLSESVLLALMGGVSGLILAYWGVRALASLAIGNIPRLVTDADVSVMDWRVLVFTLGVSVFTGILFGIFPAVRFSRPDVASVLQQTSGRSGTGARQNRARGLLVISEIALALILLISATLLIRTIVALRGVHPGFDAHNVIVMEVSLASTRYTANSALETLTRQAVQRIESVPGVLGAAPAVAAPLAGIGLDLPFTIENKPPSGGDRYNGDEQWRFVGPHYFTVLGIPLRKGRMFSEQDTLNVPHAVIINEAMAKKYWPNEDPIGRRITIGTGLGPQFEEPAREIAGIVADVREVGLNRPPVPVMYIPIAQMSDALIAFANAVIPITWIVHTAPDPQTLAEAIRRQFLSIDPQLAVAHIRTLEQANAETMARERFSMALLSIFASIALLLAAIGIYALMSHSVQQRTQELGIRLALGASRRDTLKLILGEAMKLASIGVIFGVLGAFGLTRLLSSLLFGVRPTDPITFAAVSLLLGVVAFVAAYVPARRAMALDPVIALRYE